MLIHEIKECLLRIIAVMRDWCHLLSLAFLSSIMNVLEDRDVGYNFLEKRQFLWFLMIEKKNSLKLPKTTISVNHTYNFWVFVTPPRNRAGVKISLQFVCVFVSVCVCL